MGLDVTHVAYLYTKLPYNRSIDVRIGLLVRIRILQPYGMFERRLGYMCTSDIECELTCDVISSALCHFHCVTILILQHVCDV